MLNILKGIGYILYFTIKMIFMSGMCDHCDNPIWMWNQCYWTDTVAKWSSFRFMICEDCKNKTKYKMSLTNKKTKKIIIPQKNIKDFYQEYLSYLLCKDIHFKYSILIPSIPILGFLFNTFLLIKLSNISNVFSKQSIHIVKYISTVHWKNEKKIKLNENENIFFNTFMKNNLLKNILYSSIYYKKSFGKNHILYEKFIEDYINTSIITHYTYSNNNHMN